MAEALQVGYVRVQTSDPPMSVTALLSQDQPKVEAGFGGWEEIARPRRAPLTTYKSSPGLRMTLPILLDNWTSGQPVETQISNLQLMGRPVSSDGEPPQITVSARGSAIPYQGRTWVLADLGFGDALMNDGGDRVRQQVTLNLLEHVADVYLEERSAANQQRDKAAAKKTQRGASKKRSGVGGRAGGGGGGGVSGGLLRSAETPSLLGAGTFTDRPFGSGETLVRIAARDLGDATRWTELAELNDLRDPRAVPFGLVIRLP